MVVDVPSEVEKILGAFRCHGVEFTKFSSDGEQAIGNCPFTGKENKFYVNVKTGQWDSKTGIIGGNVYTFLGKIAEQNAINLSESIEHNRLKQLSESRGLHTNAFTNIEHKIGIGVNGLYTIPIYNEKGTCVDIKRYKVGDKLKGTTGCSVGLWGMDRLHKHKNEDGIVWLCEGEWDGIALSWIVNELKKEDCVVAVPGASILKKEWLQAFQGKRIYLMYDNDDAGDNGRDKALKMLSDIALEIKTIEWPVGKRYTKGYDVRDYIKDSLIASKTPEMIYEDFILLVNVQNQIMQENAATHVEALKNKSTDENDVVGKNCDFDELKKAYQKWLYLPNTEVLEIMYGTIFANKFGNEPLWIFLVAPSGGCKSELLMSLSDSKHVHTVSTLTPHSLVSGMNTSGGDPSLIPKLNDKVLVIKDFTTILSMNPLARDELLGQIRDCYDCKFEKSYGNGVVRRYKSKFGILAGVTPAIDKFTAIQAGLGERFLKYRMKGALDTNEHIKLLEAASQNNNRENEMRAELRIMAERFIASRMNLINPSMIPVLGDEIRLKLFHASMLAGSLRGNVNRDIYDKEMLTAKGSIEIATRVSKQLTRLTQGVAMVKGETEISEETYKTVAKVAMGSVDDIIIDVLRSMIKYPNDATVGGILSKNVDLTYQTIYRTLKNFKLLRLVTSKSVGTNQIFSFSENIIEHIKISEIGCVI